MIYNIHKDITTVTSGLIAHGVNCQRAMGSGVALAIKTKWPIIYEVYMESDSSIGMVDHVEVGDLLYVSNCYTQEFYGSDGKQYASIDAIKTALQSVYEFAEQYNIDVNLPKIGSDRGGLDWTTEVLPIIEDLDATHGTVTTNIYIWK